MLSDALSLSQLPPCSNSEGEGFPEEFRCHSVLAAAAAEVCKRFSIGYKKTQRETTNR